jgi:hypothetical protein
LASAANHAFFDGFTIGCMVAGGVALAGAVAAAILLPDHPTGTGPDVTLARRRASFTNRAR